MRKDIKIVLVIVFVCGLFMGAVSFAIYQRVHQIRNVGVIRAIGVDVYKDENLTEVLDAIDWGLISPRANKTFPAWVKNTGNDAQKLVMWTESWNPMNTSDWISLSWNYDGSWIPVNGSVPVGFTLSVNPNITGIANFSFDIWIKGVY